MNQYRPSSSSVSERRPQMSTHYKPRIKDSSQRDIKLAASNTFYGTPKTKAILGDSKYDPDFSSRKEEEFNKTACRLSRSNFRHHDPYLCVCDECTCGRHLCKLHVIKPGMTKNSIYKQDYDKKKPVLNKINIATEYDKLKGPNLNMNSTYGKDFPGSKGDQLQRPRPEDLLSSSGPCPTKTSYSAGFPGHFGPNQYVKPTDKHYRGHIPFNAKTTYGKNFPSKTPRANDYTYIPDQLKTGKNWFGDTTYGDKFRQPNPEDYANRYRKVQNLQKNPDFNHQYETTYKNDFLKTGSTVCPAKISLEKKLGFYSTSKEKFNENFDHRAISSDFRATRQSFA